MKLVVMLERVREQEMRDEAEGLKEVTTQPRRDLASGARQGLGCWDYSGFKCRRYDTGRCP